MQLIIDERAGPDEREALLEIMTGQDTAEMATMWWVYAAMCPTKLDPLFKAIEFEVDVDARRARLVVPGIIESSGEPIRNPVTGAEHRIRLDLPDGFEYRLAEMGGGRTKVLGQIQLAFTHTYGQFRASIWAMRASSISTPAEWFARRERAAVMASLAVTVALAWSWLLTGAAVDMAGG